MSLLANLNSTILTTSVLSSLRKNNINNVFNFLDEDDERLVNITSLSYKDVSNLRIFILEKHRGKILRGQQLSDYFKLSRNMPTGIQRLDESLEGGFPIGKITEVCGLPSSGKSQFAFTIVSHVAAIEKCNVIYIDTKGDFSGTRIYEILHESGINSEDIGLSLNRIKVAKVLNMYSLINFLHDLRRNERKLKLVRLIVIDSLPILALQHQGEKIKGALSGHELLNSLVSILRLLGNEYRISVVVVNIQTRWVEAGQFDSEGGNKKPIVKLTAALGKHWQFIPYLQLILSREVGKSQIRLEIKRSYCGDVNVLDFDLTRRGIV